MPQNLSHAIAMLANINSTEILTVLLTVTISLGLCRYVKKEIINFSRQLFLKNLLQKSSGLIYALIFSLAFSVVQVGFMVKHLDSSLIYIGNALSAAWFFSSLIYLISNRRISIWFILLIVLPTTICHILGIWGTVEQYLSSLSVTVGAYNLSAYKLLKSIILILVMFWLVSAILSFFDAQIEKSKTFKKNETMIFIQFIKIVSYLGAFIIALQIIGIDLTVFAIFGGAIGVGVGLGLQKITANFISGFIMLFEKTIKVNDLIELGDGLLGYVRFTGARHTLIETFSGKEIVIPNEEFIIHKVTNWTHSHNKARIELTVGVSYDSDLRLVKSLILSAAKECPKVAKTPEPSCYLETFADSSVNFLLYFWVNDVNEGRKTPKSEVMFAIWDKFKAHGITIPFPQRDLTIRQEIIKTKENAKAKALEEPIF